jgi:hypothetical protein
LRSTCIHDASICSKQFSVLNHKLNESTCKHHQDSKTLNHENRCNCLKYFFEQQPNSSHQPKISGLTLMHLKCISNCSECVFKVVLTFLIFSNFKKQKEKIFASSDYIFTKICVKKWENCWCDPQNNKKTKKIEPTFLPKIKNTLVWYHP